MAKSAYWTRLSPKIHEFLPMSQFTTKWVSSVFSIAFSWSMPSWKPRECILRWNATFRLIKSHFRGLNIRFQFEIVYSIMGWYLLHPPWGHLYRNRRSTDAHSDTMELVNICCTHHVSCLIQQQTCTEINAGRTFEIFKKTLLESAYPYTFRTPSARFFLAMVCPCSRLRQEDESHTLFSFWINSLLPHI